MAADGLSGPVTVSVIVPAYQAATTIADALDSALAQEPPPLEVIVSDDGSTDDLDEVLARYEGRVVVVRGPNGGLAVARNRAAAVARGTVLGLLDADDVWVQGRLAALVDAFTRHPELDIVTTDAYVVRDGVRDAATYYASRHWAEEDQLEAILERNFIFGAAGIRRSAFERAGGYEPAARAAEDWDLWLRMLAAGSHAGLVREPLYEYRRRGDSITRQKVDLALGVLAALERAQALPLDDAHRRVLARTIARWRVDAARAARASGDRRALRLATSAVTDRHVVERVARRLLRPARARWRRAVERADPARLALGAAGPAGPVTVVGVYRARNADVVRRQLDGVPAGTTVRLWALDRAGDGLDDVTVGTGPGTRFELLNRLVAPLDGTGVLVLCDDDVRFVVGDLGSLVALGGSLGFDVFQPAHSRTSFASRATEALVRRRPLTVARATGFVEQGPVVVLSEAARAALLPLPEDMGMGWGAEVRWSTTARDRCLRMGVVDAVVVQHLAPPGGGYDTAVEIERVRTELAAAGVEDLADLQVELGRTGLLSALRRRGRGSSAPR